MSQRQVSVLSLSMLSILLCGGIASAIGAPSQQSDASNLALMQQQLIQLEQQLNQLNQTLDSSTKAKKVQKVSASTPAPLGQYTARYEQGHQMATTDSAAYFELLPNTTFQLALLQDKADFANHSIAIGGYMESDLQYWNTQPLNATPTPYQTVGSQFAVTQVNVDVMSNINEWTQAFVSYEGLNLTNTTQQTFKVEKAFLTVGNLQKAPVYLTVGKTYIPFGVFGSNAPWASELGKTYVRSNEIPQVILGFFEQGLSSSLSVFSNSIKGDAANFALDMGYSYTINKSWNFAVGAGYLNDIRATNSAIGSAFSGDSPTLKSDGINPAIDVNAMVGYQIYALSAEYDQTLRNNYATLNNANNGKIRTWYVSGSASPQVIMTQPTTFQLTYTGASGIKNIPTGLTNNFIQGATALNGVKRAWILSASQPVLANWMVGVEYQLARTYENANANVYTIDSSLFF
jgi:hypothetical protein